MMSKTQSEGKIFKRLDCTRCHPDYTLKTNFNYKNSVF